MKLRVFRRAIAVLAVTGLMTSCSGGDETGGADGLGTEGAPGTGTSGTNQPGETTGYATGTNIALPLAPAEITWMHGGTEEPQRSYWEQVARDFEALHPGVTVNIVTAGSNDLRGNAIPNAISGEETPDLFQSWGGGQLTEWVNRGYARDLSEVLFPAISGLTSGATDNWQVDGGTYGLPYAAGPAGFWVNLNVLNDAGMVTGATVDESGNVVSGTVEWPGSLDGLYEMWDTLAGHGVTPVAVAGGSGWAAPWWYFALVTKTCSAAAISAGSVERDFSDPCWEAAATTLKEIVGRGAFNSDWGTTAAEGGPESSGGQVALGQAAMELNGPWGRTVLSNILQTETGNGDASFIAWYPFPDLGSVGDTGAGAGNIMAGGDGFSVIDPALSTQAQSDAAAALLGYILSEQVQAEGLNFPWHGRDVAALPGVPTNAVVAAQIADPVLASQAAALAGASNRIPWLDVYMGTTIGTAMNNSINSLMRGQISVGDALSSIRAAAGNIN